MWIFEYIYQNDIAYFLVIQIIARPVVPNMGGGAIAPQVSFLVYLSGGDEYSEGKN